MRNFVPIAALLSGLACGSSESTKVALSGSIGGETMVARDAVSHVIALPMTSSTMAAIVITDVEKVCEQGDGGRAAQGTKALMLLVLSASDTSMSAPTKTGVYPVYGREASHVTGNAVRAHYMAVDMACSTRAELDGTAGNVTLTSIGSSGYAGSFDITFSDGSHSTGTFASTECSRVNEHGTGGTCG